MKIKNKAMENLQNGKSIFQISLNITIGGYIRKIYDGRTNERYVWAFGIRHRILFQMITIKTHKFSLKSDIFIGVEQ